jgi:DNA mismatch repair protein MutL
MLLEEGPSRLEETALEGERVDQFFQKSGPVSFFGQEAFSAPSFFMSGKEESILTVQDREGLPWRPREKRPYTVLGQIRGTYILCEGEGNLVFIDQHAAHEKLLFEKLKKEYDNRSMVSERLLLPILFEASVEDSVVLESAGEALKEIGLEIEPAGEKLYAIRSIPSFIDPRDPKEFVREVLDALSFSEKRKNGEEAIHTLLVTLACHSAVRANSVLKREEMDKLVEDLIPLHSSTTCPHGRPIFFLLPLSELKKQFKRK